VSPQSKGQEVRDLNWICHYFGPASTVSGFDPHFDLGISHDVSNPIGLPAMGSNDHNLPLDFFIL
jgi:hypothetical protein